jgi:hypothetical protein
MTQAHRLFVTYLKEAMNELNTPKPSWPMHLHETVSKIEKRTRECLEECAPGGHFTNMILLDLAKVKQIMHASATESFTARVEYYESQPGFSLAAVDGVVDETVTATLKLAPMKIWITSRYKQAEPKIREELIVELRSFAATRPKRQATRPTPAPDRSMNPSAAGKMVGGLASPAHKPIKNPARRNSTYVAIDEALLLISEAVPRSHAEVFKLLDERKVRIAARKPFRTAKGWQNGYRQNPHEARMWLSKAWRQLGLPAFVRGPKK